MQKKWLRLIPISTIVAVIPLSGFALNDMKAPEVPTQTLSHIFENMPTPVAEKKSNHALPSLKDYKEKLRSLVAIHFNDSIQIGFDRIKSGPKLQREEIVDVNAHLAPQGAKVAAARGYGIHMQIKLD